MKTQIKIFILIVSVVLIPQIVSASWWNPFSWSKNSKQTTEIIEPVSVKQADEITPVSKTTTEQNSKPKVIEKIIEKPTIQTITIQDPFLQKRVEQLELENQQLRLEIEKLNALQKQVQAQKEEIESLKSMPVFSKDKECKEAKEILSSSTEKAVEMLERKNKEIKDYHTSHENQHKYQKDIDIIINKYRIEGGQIDKEMKSARSRIEIYCN